MADGLRRRGHQVTILTSRRGAAADPARETDVVRRLHNEVDTRPGYGTVQFFFGRTRRLRADIAALHETIAYCQPDAVLVWGAWNIPRPVLAAAERRGQPPVIYYLADYWPTLPDAYTLHWRAPARRRSTRMAKVWLGQVALRMNGQIPSPALRFEHVLCVSRALREKLLAAGVPIVHARVVYNGIQIAPGAPPCIAPAIAGPLALLYAGRLTPDKGVHVALDALALVVQRGHAVHFTVIGGGAPEYEAALRQQCARLGISAWVTFSGRVPRAQMPQRMAEQAVLLVPSSADEPLPRVAQEGMAAGLAVVATRVGGLPELIADGENGLLCAPADAAGLAQQIERFIVSPTLRAQLAAAGQATVRDHFSIEHTITAIENYLTTCVI